jgi:hypothetical protein
MKKQGGSSLVALAMVFLTLMSAARAAPVENVSPCHTNFVVEGGRFSGYRLKTVADFPGVRVSQAFKELAQAMAADGGTIQNSNEHLGTISALGALGPNVDKAHPVNGVVSAIDLGSRVQLTWSVAPFITFHRGDVENSFCSWLGHIAAGTKVTTSPSP